ncbi:unnamed protein product [Staurois parvus]|uniref:PH domain-containing protein n=1 Tax=Staurois parvus TaxID=386267 RepID=A0ABN9G9B9_9NEOB|nr:unnamed protein product [Staurois parvus]
MRAYIQHREHENAGMRTYYFSADTQEDMNGWIRAMNQATLVQSTPENKRDIVDMEWPSVPVNNHIESFKEFPQPEPVQMRSNYSKPKEPPPSRNEEPRRNSGEKEQYRDVRLQDGYQDEGERERYPVVGEKERYRETGDKERFREAADKELYRNGEDKERQREPEKELHRTGGGKDRQRETEKELHRTGGGKDRQREPEKELHRTGGGKDRQREPEKELHRTGGDKDRQREVGLKDRFKERIDKDYYSRDLEEPERVPERARPRQLRRPQKRHQHQRGESSEFFSVQRPAVRLHRFQQKVSLCGPTDSPTADPGEERDLAGFLPDQHQSSGAERSRHLQEGLCAQSRPGETCAAAQHDGPGGAMGEGPEGRRQEYRARTVFAGLERYQTLPKTPADTPPAGSPPPSRNLFPVTTSGGRPGPVVFVGVSHLKEGDGVAAVRSGSKRQVPCFKLRGGQPHRARFTCRHHGRVLTVS